MPLPILLVLTSRKGVGGTLTGKEDGRGEEEEEGSQVLIYSVAGRHSGLVVAKGGEGRWYSGLSEIDDVIRADHRH